MYSGGGGSVYCGVPMIRTEDMRLREARETRLALAVGLSQLTEDAALARIPIYGFSIAGLMADGQAAVNTIVPLELRAPIFNARAATVGNDLFMTLAGASGGRAVINDNEPTRAVRRSSRRTAPTTSSATGRPLPWPSAARGD